MSLLKKCSCCGYKFKRGDGDICPECFTSREETLGCEDLSSDLHSHVQGFSSAGEGMTEIEKQLEQERMQAAQQKAALSMENAATIGSAATGNRSTNFGSSASKNTSSSFSSASNGGKTTTFTSNNGRTTTTTYTSNDGRKTTTYSTTYSTGGIGPMSTYRTFNSSNNNSQKSSKIVKIVLIFIIVSFIFSFVVPIIVAVVGINAAKKSEDDSSNFNAITYVSPDISIPDISLPDVSIPDVSVPDVPSVDTDGFYYDDYAVLNQGAEIKTDNFVIKVGDPHITDVKPSQYDEEYAYYTDYENPDECVTLEVPFTVKNNSGETLRIYDLFTYIISMTAVPEEEYAYEQFYSDSLATSVFTDSVIENGVTYTFALHYPVPKADIYSVSVVLKDENGEDYYYYIHYYADEVE